MLVALKRFVVPLVLSLLAVGCSSSRPDARLQLAVGERAFRDKHYAHADEQLTRFIEQAHGDPRLARALYVRGMARAMLGKRSQARGDLERAARESDDPTVSWQPIAVLGVLSFEDEDWYTARRELTRAIDHMPDVPPKDALLYRVGLCEERTGRWKAAQATYRRIIAQFPRGAYREPAERRLQLEADHYAVQCGVFTRAENARRLASELAERGLRVYVRQERRGDALYHVVLEGRYTSHREATQALARVRGYVLGAVLWP